MKTKLLAFLFLATALALHAQNQPAARPVRGIVTVVVGPTVTIASNKLGAMAYTTDHQTSIRKLDGSAGTLADLTAGATVLVTTGSNPNEAAKIQLVKPKSAGNSKNH